MKSSELLFAEDIVETLAEWRNKNDASDVVVICDTNTREKCLPLLGTEFQHVIAIQPGEINKQLYSAEYILKELIEKGVGKNHLIVGLGGGVVTDIAGFVASVYRRGSRLIQIPTSLMGMVDAAIGGKTGVDLLNFKNYVGTFYRPEAIIIHPGFLETLDELEKRSAFAEIIKIAVMCDSELYGLLESRTPIEVLIKNCARLKMQIVEKDPYDRGERQKLNFGHTIGHAYESFRLSAGDPIHHGFAVGVGMIEELKIAVRLGLINDHLSNRISSLIFDTLKIEPLHGAWSRDLNMFLKGDKKNTDDKITFSLPTGIGTGITGVKLRIEEISNV